MDEQVVEKAHRAAAEESRRRFRWLIYFVPGLIAGGLAVWLWRPATAPPPAVEKPAAAASSASAPEAASDRVELSPAALARANLGIEEARLQSLPLPLEANGRIVINEDASARVGSPTEGRVARVMVTVGDRVRAGQPLVYVHSHELVQAQADYAKAQAAVTRTAKNLAYAQAELERASRLLEAKAISARERMRAEADVGTASSELDQARAEMRRTEEYLSHLGVKPGGADDVVIRSPISGVVLKRNVTIGTVVNPAEDLMVVANLNTLWAVAEVPERQASAVRAGQPVQLTVAAFADARFPGRVVYLGESLDPATRTVQVRCLIQNPRQQLRPEMYAAIRIDAGRTQPVLAVPRNAVQEVKGERVVFLAVGEGAFEKRVVQTGREQSEWIEITSGIEAGQRVVARGSFFIKSAFLKGAMEEE
jgi:cobalt-zinc-cadmium efflux system membrane fusion protein